jgi:hypothetical protein
VAFVEPPDGVVDAREPNPVGSLTPAEGIDAVLVSASAGAGALGCWTLCESQTFVTPNDVAGVTDNGDGTYVVRFLRPITKGAVTTLTYEGTGTTGRFIFHPGNINGDGFTNIGDMTSLVDALQGISLPPWGVYSTDINRTGVVTIAEVLWLADILNGGGFFAPGWNGSPKPTPGSCP